MLDPKLQIVCELIGNWCNSNDVRYSVVCDENDVQCIFLFGEDKPNIESLDGVLNKQLYLNKIHLKKSKVRGGIILALSLKALSESTFNDIISNMMVKHGNKQMTFKNRVDNAFNNTIHISENVDMNINIDNTSFIESAKRIAESYKSRQAMTKTQKNCETPKERVFELQLCEALDGMATENNVQPNDLFNKFGTALRTFGDKLGLGPVQDMLKKRGIKYNKSKDGQAIILYVINGQTKTPQPIARINSSLLEKPADFEAQLLNILDFAKGEAPGTTKQRQEELKNQQTVARDIAQQMQPQDQLLTQQPQAQPQQPQAQQTQMRQPTPKMQPAPTAAAQQAASLKM